MTGKRDWKPASAPDICHPEFLTPVFAAAMPDSRVQGLIRPARIVSAPVKRRAHNGFPRPA
jgi:hypothetical protein